MGGKTDIVKGRIKEAVGVLTNNDVLRAEGNADQVAGNAKQAVQATVDKAKQAAQDAVDTVRNSL